MSTVYQITIEYGQLNAAAQPEPRLAYHLSHLGQGLREARFPDE